MDLKICPACGAWSQRPHVPADEEVVVCAGCGNRRPFRRLPLLALTGPSGTGKSTVGDALVEQLSQHLVVIEQDLLWVPQLRDPDGGYSLFRSTWLRLVSAIHQNGRPVLLCGTVVPGQLEACDERDLVGEIHYAALTCDDDELADRLRARPPWREWTPERVAEMVAFNCWVRQHAATTTAAMRLFDTTRTSVATTVGAVRRWATAVLKKSGVIDGPQQ